MLSKRSPPFLLLAGVVVYKWSLPLLAVLLVLPGHFQGQAGLMAAASVRPDLCLLRSDESGVVIELLTPEYAISRQDLFPYGTFHHLTAPGLELTAMPGQPEVPFAGVVLGVPPDAQVEVNVLLDESVPLPGYFRLVPAPRPGSIEEDLREPDPVVYASDSWYPARPAHLADDAWLRDQRLVRLELFPFQYNAARGMLLWHRRMQVEVRFQRSALTWQGNSVVEASPFEDILRSSVLNYESARLWRGRPETLVKSEARAQAAADTMPRYKIVVDRDGIYRLTYADLLAAGMEVDTIDPRTFHLTSQGQDVAIHVVGDEDGKFDPDDYIVFYGQKFRGDLLAAQYESEDDFWPTLGYGWQPHFNALMLEKYTDENVYWLMVGGTAGPRMGTLDGTPHYTATVPSSYRATVHAEQSNEWYTFHFSSEDTWFWEQKNSTQPFTLTYTMTLTALAAEPFSATVRAHVATRDENTRRTRFLLNDPPTLLDDATWSGKRGRYIEAQVPESALVEGQNTLYVNTIPQSGSAWIYFNWFEIEYNRRFQATSDQLVFSGVQTGTWQYEVGNLMTETVAVYDVTDPFSPRRVLSHTIVAGSGIYTAVFQVTHDLGARYFVAGGTAFPQSPKYISRYIPPDFSNGADYIFITHRSLITATQTLADYRASEGLRVKVVDVDDLYNEFNYGIYHSIAIKNFLRYAYANWQPPAPAYVLLIGDGHWNFKGDGVAKYGTPPPIYLPPHLAWVDYVQGEVDDATSLAMIVGNDILPDLHIGRLPVNSEAELNAAIAKIIAYEQAGTQDWQRRAIFVADNVPDPKGAGDFVQVSDDLIAHFLPATLQADRIYLNDYGCPFNSPCPVVNNAITRTWNMTGALLVNFVGHGSLNRWTDESVFVNSDIASLDNGSRLPVILSMTCLDGYWLKPDQQGLIEELVRASNRGAIGTFSPTGLGFVGGHDVLNRGFFTAVFTDGIQRLGPAALAAKMALYNAGHNYDLIHTYTVFGDPALRLPTFQLALTPTLATQNGNPGAVVAYTLRVTNTGLLTDTVTFTNTASMWPISFSTHGLTLAPGTGDSFQVFVTIPATATVGITDTVTVTALSHGDSTRASARLTTRADWYKTFLPLVVRQ